MILDVRVIPRARKTEIGGERDGRMVVRLVAAPVDGAANDALVDFLASHYHVPRTHVRIVSGQHSRNKRVEIQSPR
jgi:uncharacterized protein